MIFFASNNNSLVWDEIFTFEITYFASDHDFDRNSSFDIKKTTDKHYDGIKSSSSNKKNRLKHK